MTDVLTITTTNDVTVSDTTTVLIDVGYSLPLTGSVPTGGGGMTGPLVLGGSPAVTIPANALAGKVLTSDGSGDGSWQFSTQLPAPAAWWQLGDAVSSTTAADSSGNGWTGAASGITFGATGPAVSTATAATFGGSPDGILTSYSPSGWSAITVEAWVNCNSQAETGNPRFVANSHTDQDDKGFELYMTSGRVPKVTFGNGTVNATAQAAVAMGTTGWNYVAATWDGTTVTLYVNGVSAGTASLSGTLQAGTGTGVSIGYDAAYSGDYFKGNLAQVMISPVVLTATQVALRYAGALPSSKQEAIPAWGAALSGIAPVPASGDTTGATDTANILTDLGSASSGSNLYLAAGTFHTNAPIVLPAKSISLCGEEGAMQGGSGSPGVGTIIRPVAAFAQGSASVNAVIVGGAASRQNIQDIWVNGQDASAVTDLEGIDFSTSDGGHSLYRVGVNNMTSWGVYASGFLGWLYDTGIIQTCGTLVSSLHLDGSFAGAYYAGSTDCCHINVHTQTVTGYGIDVHGGDHRFLGCRADLSTQQGFRLYSFNAGAGTGLGVMMIACATEANQQEGCYMGGGGADTYGPYQLVGCAFTGDGQAAAGIGAMRCDGRVTASLTDVNVSGGGSGGSITYPSYSLVTTSDSGTHAVPDLVSVRGGVWQAATAFIEQTAAPTRLIVDPTTVGIIGAINGTSGTTRYVQVQDTGANTTVLPSGDTTGATDVANLQALVAQGASIAIGPGNFYVNQPIVVKQTNVSFSGMGSATMLNVATGFSDPSSVTPAGMLLPGVFQIGNLDSSGNNCTIRNMVIQGISSTVTSNPGATGINNDGCSSVRTTGLTFNFLNGWAIEAMSGAGGSHEVNRCFYEDLLIVNCAGNIHINGQGYTVNSVMANINCPSSGVTTGPAANLDGIHLDHCDDVVMTNVNPGNGNSGSAWHMTNVAAVWLTSSDYAGGSAAPGMLIDGSTSGVYIANAVISSGTAALSITGSTQHVTIMNCSITGGQADGADVSTTGGGIVFQNCYFGQGSPGNGAGASGTNYDLNWSGTGTGTVADCIFTSGIVATGNVGVQYSVNIAANQKVIFDSCRFLGGGASSANWFTNTPSAVLRTDSGVFDFTAGLSVRANPHPALYGLASWTVDPVACSTNTFQLATAGTGYGSALYVASWATISKLYMVLTTAGGTLTSGQCFGVIYNSAGNLIGYTGDESTAWAGSAGLLSMSLTAESSGSLTLTPGKYYVGVYYNGTTAPKFLSCAGSPYFAAVDANTTGSSARAVTLFTGATGTIPATCTFTAGGILLWAGID